jgi:cytochrome P450
MIDFTSPDLLADPYPLYHAIRATQPTVWLDYGNGTAFWMLTRYADCEAALRNPLLGRWDNTVGRDEWRRQHHVEPTPVQRVLEEWMLFRNPPDHTRLRALVTKAFSPRRIEALRERIAVISNELLDRVEAKGSFELIDDYAVRVPVRVISEMMGVPYEDFETFREWTEGMGGIIDFNPPADEIARAMAAAGPFTAYFTELIEQHRRQPKDDLLSALIEAEEQGDKLTEAELMAQCILLLVAGHETTKT